MAGACPSALNLPADVLLDLGSLFRPRPSEIEDEHLVDRTSLWTWASLPAVCKKWRDVFLGSPAHWSYIVLPVNHVHPRRIFARAQGAPLDVYIEVVDNMTIDEEQRLADGLSLLEEYSQQLRLFCLRNNGTQPIRKALLTWIFEILDRPLPQLSHLYFHDGLPPPWQRATALTRDIALQAPALRSMSTRGYHRLNWTHKTADAPELRNLRLGFLNFHHMRGALAYLPHLRSVDIDLGEGQLAQGVSWIPTPRSLVWPSLQEITLRCHPSDVVVFWEALDIPRLVEAELIIRHMSPFIAHAELQTSLSTALALFLPNRTNDPDLLMHDALTLTCPEDEATVVFQWSTGGTDVHALDAIHDDIEGFTAKPRSTSIAMDLVVVPGALDLQRTYFDNLRSLCFDLDDIKGRIMATFMLDYVRSWSSVQLLRIHGHDTAEYILAVLTAVADSCFFDLGQLVIGKGGRSGDSYFLAMY
ncbi:unnamed protein product [Peniophora sp. CBMAI 1063]|nr:unnamed protein product [Peniophora sp. CBMAI 1063]